MNDVNAIPTTAMISFSSNARSSGCCNNVSNEPHRSLLECPGCYTRTPWLWKCLRQFCFDVFGCFHLCCFCLLRLRLHISYNKFCDRTLLIFTLEVWMSNQDLADVCLGHLLT